MVTVANTVETTYLTIRRARQTHTTHQAVRMSWNPDRMIAEQVTALLRLLAEWEREELGLLMQ